MRRFLLNALLVGASILVALVLFEIALRVIGFRHPNFYVPDPVTGISLRPGAEGWNTKEGKAYVRVSPQGLRDREHPVAKPPGTWRIAVLGDSFTEALQVEAKDAWWAQLEQRLATCPSKPAARVEVMNFGVSGYGTAQAYRMLETRVLPFKPDLVILGFYTGNDIRNNSAALEPDKMRPFFRIDKTGALEMDTSFAQDPEFLRRTSGPRRLLHDLTQQVRTLQLGFMIREVLASRAAAAAPAGQEAGIDDAVMLPPRDAKWEDAWRITEASLLQMRTLASRAGAGLAVMTIPMGVQVHPDRAVREAALKKLGTEELFYAERRLAAFGRQNALAVIATGPEMLAQAESTKAFMHGFANTTPGSGHWNENGHRVGAEILARELCKAPATSLAGPAS